jgi:hypothetical protein
LTAQLSPPIGRTTCPICGADLKIKLKFSNFLLPVYFGVRGTLGLLFNVRFDAGFFGEIAIVVTLALLQIWLTAYKEAGNTGNRPN